MNDKPNTCPLDATCRHWGVVLQQGHCLCGGLAYPHTRCACLGCDTFDPATPERACGNACTRQMPDGAGDMYQGKAECEECDRLRRHVLRLEAAAAQGLKDAVDRKGETHLVPHWPNGQTCRHWQQHDCQVGRACNGMGANRPWSCSNYCPVASAADPDTRCTSCGMVTTQLRGAVRLADEVAAAVLRGKLHTRTPVVDALEDFRDPPSTPRADRLAALEGEVERLELQVREAEDRASDAEDAAGRMHTSSSVWSAWRRKEASSCACSLKSERDEARADALMARIEKALGQEAIARARGTFRSRPTLPSTSRPGRSASTPSSGRRR